MAKYKDYKCYCEDYFGSWSVDSYLNKDIAACANDNCPKRLTCLRWQLGTNKDPYQTYLDGSMCEEDFYIENK